MSGRPPAPIVELGRRLRRARRRMWLARMVRAVRPLLVGTGVGAAALVVLVNQESVPIVLATAGVFVLVGVSVAGVRVARAVAAAAVVARDVDRSLGLRGRCAATVDVAAKRRRSRVDRALLASVPDWLDRVDAISAVPLRGNRLLAQVVPLWMVVVVAAAWSPELADRTTARVSRVDPSEARVESSPRAHETREKLERFRYLLSQEAEVRDDPELHALAEEAGHLATRIDAGGFPSADVQSEVELLGERAAQALGYAADPTFEVGDGAGDAEVGAGARPATPRDRPDPLPDDGRHDDGIEAMDAPGEGERTLDGLLDRMETSAMARAAPAADADLEDVRLRPAVEPAERGTYFDNPAVDAAAEAALAAAAARTRPDGGAGRIAGDAAGGGGGEAGGAAADLQEGRLGRRLGELDFDHERLSVSDAGFDGRRLSVLAAPATTPDDAPGVDPPDPDAWRRSGEAFQGTDHVEPGAADLVAAYHLGGGAESR